ncbi:Enhancer of split mgamma [Operophtera brumata]|uniref:Enhancer of split mgamma n=1 Tax=Operophtera brumata TaxID=104452 RepID=A0A0L7KYW3_OPEBR|nr:Enhancer of split mgamma [Operophtera brumata]
MSTVLQVEGGADILESTLQHLHRLRRAQLVLPQPESAYKKCISAGFTGCAIEVSKFIANTTVQQGVVDCCSI